MSDQDKAVEIQTEPVAQMTCSACGATIDVTSAASFSETFCTACNAKQVVPARLGGFLLRRLIGAGGMGAIYHAVDESLGREVAIKVMLKSLGEDPASLETFRREAKMAATLNHPNIVQIYSFGEAGGQPYIVMELITGKSLDDLMTDHGALHPAQVMQIAVDVARGLGAASDMGLIHGDVKPKNILLDAKDTAKVVDFGLATFADKQVTEQGIWGTPYYISPEKVRKQPIDARSDIYSLGGTLYHALAGQPPFDGKTPVDVVKARLTRMPRDLSLIRRELPDYVCRIVMRMLAQQPSLRYPTYASLQGDLEEALKKVKDESARLGFQPGMKVVTKKMKRTLYVPTDMDSSLKKTVSPKERLMVEPGGGGKKKGCAWKSFLIVFLVVLIAGGGGAGTFFALKARRERTAGIVSQVGVEYSAMVEPAQKQISRAREAAPKILAFKKMAEQSGTKVGMICSKALSYSGDALAKAKQLESILAQAAKANTEAKKATSPASAGMHLDAVAGHRKTAEGLQKDIESLLAKASEQLARAAEIMQKDAANAAK